MSLILGIAYAVACGIEVFGFFAAISRRINLIRIYAFSTFISTVLVIGAGVFGIVTDFTLKNDWLSECTKIATGETVSIVRTWPLAC